MSQPPPWQPTQLPPGPGQRGYVPNPSQPAFPNDPGIGFGPGTFIHPDDFQRQFMQDAARGSHRTQPPPLTPEQHTALRRVNRLKVANILLFFPFLASLGWWVDGTHYLSMRLVPLILILVLVTRNKVVKRRRAPGQSEGRQGT
jgi:hypothetical protein